MAAHTPSFTIFWSRGWPHNAVRISTFCASSASEFYHTVLITPEARCKQVTRDLRLMWTWWMRDLIAHGSDWCSSHLLYDTHGLNLHTAEINWNCDDLSRPLKENREVGSTTASTKHSNGSGSRARRVGLVKLLLFGYACKWIILLK